MIIGNDHFCITIFIFTANTSKLLFKKDDARFVGVMFMQGCYTFSNGTMRITQTWWNLLILTVNFHSTGSLLEVPCSVRLFIYLTYSSQREFSIEVSHLSSDSSKGSGNNQDTVKHLPSNKQAQALRYTSHRGWILLWVSTVSAQSCNEAYLWHRSAWF